MMVTNGVADVTVANRMTVFPSSPSVTGEATTVRACWRARVLSAEAARLRDSESAFGFSGRSRHQKKYTGAARRHVLKP